MLKRLLGWENAAPAATTEADVATARALQQQGAQLVDVREPYEFAAGHAQGAVNIPLGQLPDRLGEISRDRTVLLICRSGNRSRTAQGLLRRHGIADTRNVSGGTLAWQASRLPVR